MPEYLAPAVYVEEIDTGNKPIEGVSTSTAGMIGVTERGPAGVPILVTSYGEYVRWFGERLNRADFGDHCYLPHAVDGFFTNGGKRVFITRVEASGAARASFELHDHGGANSAATLLLRAAPVGTGTGDPGNTPIYVLDINSPGASALADDDHIRLGDDSDAEYRIIHKIEPAASTTHVPLSFPLSRAHASAVTVHQINRVPIAFPSTATALALASDAHASDNAAVVSGAAGDVATLAADQLLEIGDPFFNEHRFIRSAVVDPADNTRVRLTLDAPLALDHAAAANAVRRLDINLANAAVPVDDDTLSVAALANDRVVYVTDRNNNFVDRTTVAIFDIGNTAVREARRIGVLSMLTLATGVYAATPAGSVVERVDLGDDGAVTAKALTAAARAGTAVIALDNRVDLKVNGILRIGAAPDDEYLVIAELPNHSPGSAAPDAGNVVLARALKRDHPAGAPARLQNNPTVNTASPATALLLDTELGSMSLPVTDGTGYAQDEFVRVTPPGSQPLYHRLAGNAATVDARLVDLTVPLSRAHAAGAAVAERAPLLAVQALDTGDWGNRLRVSVQDEPAGVVPRTTVSSVIDATHIRLASAAGVEAGTILEVFNPVGGATVGDLLKVTEVNRGANFTITLDGAGISVAQSAPGLAVRSREFRLSVYLFRQPDPAIPARNETILDSEVFRYLSMDPRHSRYVQDIIGDINGALRISDRRPEGESRYIRVSDLNPNTDIRLGPETLVDRLPDGRLRPARHALGDLVRGNDSIGTLTEDDYVGQDSQDPEARTGLHSLRNVEEISIVACPGRTTAVMQNALIAHCELMRYRVAVLDGPRPPQDTLSDVQTQRQQYDTKYAALYHPWLLIPDPYPVNLSQIADYPIPPSGHIVGIYARTDIERGVHKAPANEVVRGITGLQRILNKEQHDILNPYPVNINVIRDFRDANRGIRVYGGRIITGDPDWRYLNMRRLMIFIEASIDRGLQWVVFEPNKEDLWARVRRSISNFLTLVWRNGGLEGTKVEEAYFVKCDRTTMTQTDIDNGRLICVVGVALVKPAEFVIVRIGLWTAHAED
jgi:Bacteriophage tail sheath protein